VLAYLVRRTAFGFATLLGVLGLLFALFFLTASPEDMARRAMGERVPGEVIEQWIANHGYDRPLFWNPEAPLDTLFVDHYRRMLLLDFGRSDADEAPIAERLRRGLGPTLSLTLPILLLGLLLALTLSLLVAYFRETYIDRAGVSLCVLGMSLSILLYIIGGQYLLGRLLRWFPISGFDPSPEVLARFVALPALVGILAHLGADVRFYRTALLEETGRDYVRTARAKGAGDLRIMVRHVLPNALIPILSRVTLVIPFLFTGSILLESFFGIPGLGSLTVTAIKDNDFSTLRAVVFIGALIFIAAQILADVAYTLVDPRVRLE